MHNRLFVRSSQELHVQVQSLLPGPIAPQHLHTDTYHFWGECHSPLYTPKHRSCYTSKKRRGIESPVLGGSQRKSYQERALGSHHRYQGTLGRRLMPQPGRQVPAHAHGLALRASAWKRLAQSSLPPLPADPLPSHPLLPAPVSSTALSNNNSATWLPQAWEHPSINAALNEWEACGIHLLAVAVSSHALAAGALLAVGHQAVLRRSLSRQPEILHIRLRRLTMSPSPGSPEAPAE